MKWFGLGLLLFAALVALIAGFGFHNAGFCIGGIVFAIIGLIVFLTTKNED